jgi:hypothetical protein
MRPTDPATALTHGQMAKALRIGGADAIDAAQAPGPGIPTATDPAREHARRLGATITLGMLVMGALATAHATENRRESVDFGRSTASATAARGSIPRPAAAAPGPVRAHASADRGIQAAAPSQEQSKMLSKLTGMAAATAVGVSATIAGAQTASGIVDLGDWGGPADGEFRSINCSPYGNAVGVNLSGELRTWGPNTATSNAPRDGGYVAAAVGQSFGIAMKADGSLRHWGDNTYGQATFPAPTFKAISCGDWTVVAIKSDGSLAAWGSDSAGELTQVPAGNDYEKVASGNWHHLAIKQDGRVRAWGFNTTGACDVPQDLTAHAVAAGWQFSFAARTDGGLTWWGTDHQNAMNGMPRDTGYIDVAFNVREGTGGGIALRNDGTIVTWPTDTVPSGAFARSVTTGFAIRDFDCDGSGTGDLMQIATGELSDLDGNRVPDTCECLGDLYVDGFVNGADLGALLAYWGPVTGTPASQAADIDRDGVVNGSDLGILLAGWGACAP